jgi:hypothetical protein
MALRRLESSVPEDDLLVVRKRVPANSSLKYVRVVGVLADRTEVEHPVVCSVSVI